MSSRAEQKAAARAARLAAEENESRRTARRRALWRLGALAGAALAVVTGAILLSTRGDDAPVAARGGDTGALFAGIPQRGIALGAPDAPATLVEFADLQCPYCAAYARDVLPVVVGRYVRSGRLRLELRLRAFLGEDSRRGAVLAAAAARQDRLWPFVDAFYRNQGAENTGYVTDAFLRERVREAGGLDLQQALADRDHPATHRTLADAERLAATLGSDSTPDFYLRRGDGRVEALAPDALTPGAFTAALDDALAAR